MPRLQDVPAITWQESDVQLDAMSWRDDDKLVYLDGSYFQGAVGAGRRKELLLFRRKAFSKEWRFHQRR
eukprot:768160-Hanusia_phi.AAC.1